MDRTNLKLIEKIIRAKVILEKGHTEHHDRCMVEMDPDYMGPCTCGATSSNKTIDAALRALKLDDE